VAYFKTISPVAARELIYAHRLQGWGRTISVAWDRRTTSDDGQREQGQLEVLTLRFGVKKHLRTQLHDGQVAGSGSSAAYDRAEKGLFCGFAMSRKYNGISERVNGYRCVPFDQMRWLKLDGNIYKIGAAPAPQR